VSKYKPQVGDLVCYNVAGMRNKSLGMVMDTHRKNGVRYIRIYWTKRPSIPPRSEFVDVNSLAPDWRPDRDRVEGWYPDKGCFEVISELEPEK